MENVDKSSTAYFYQKKCLFSANNIIFPDTCQKYTVSISGDIAKTKDWGWIIDARVTHDRRYNGGWINGARKDA